MTKTGKLSKRERDTLLRAAQILNDWCDAHANGEGYLDEFTYSSASEAAGAINNFLYETEGE